MDNSTLKAILGPTNTGKTHLAVERLCAHSSGIIGFPLRLLAREIYDRVVKIKGARNVALITGEERIAPPDAKWLLCTTESMPLEKDVAFVAIDEVQLGNDPERGHIFTDRLLNSRGREETMLLGSESLKPLIRSLLPKTEIITRPRFSKLSFTPPKKLSRLPARSAVVAFSVEEVYRIAEMLRQSRGGAAVVMGALSPRTRNAQVQMYQDGEVDYLVATDAIGMGLNMDVGSVYFASLSKYDGRRQRHLSIAEMAQIAGRAGRHQRDGHFGTITGSDTFLPEEIDRIEDHNFPKVDHLYWRNSDPDYQSIDALIASLEIQPRHPRLRAAPEADDLTILKILAEDTDIREKARSPQRIAALWDICRLPDFQKLGPQFHARLVSRIFGFLSSGDGYLPEHMFADQIARLDSIQGDVSAVAARIAVARTWAYIAQRESWLHNPEKWRLRAIALDEKLSDALHAKLTERFVDKRAKMLIKNAPTAMASLAAVIDDDGTVLVENQMIGRLNGFTFSVDPLTSLVDRKRLAAAAEKHLSWELRSRADKLASTPNSDIMMRTNPGEAITLCWNDIDVAQLARGKSLLAPKIELDAAILKLNATYNALITNRLATWLSEKIANELSSLVRLEQLSMNVASTAVRTLVAALIHRGGIIERHEIEESINALNSDERRSFTKAGLVIGSLDIFYPVLLKPRATRLRLALDSVQKGQAMPPLPTAGHCFLARPGLNVAKAAQIAGFRTYGNQMVRIDLLEKIARKAHNRRNGRQPFAADTQIAATFGVGEDTFGRIMRSLGFAQVFVDEVAHWRWSGVKRKSAPKVPNNPAFSALGDWNNGKAA
ncbi:MAG: helicase-related protein [Sphingomonadaceae bacterium]